MIWLFNDVFAMGQKNIEPNFTLPPLLQGSEYKSNDPDEYRELNLLGQAIAIVVRAEEIKAPNSKREVWFNLWEAESKNVDQYSKKRAQFQHSHDPTRYLPPDMNQEDPYYILIHNWFHNSLFTNPDWDTLYSLIVSQTKPSDRHHSEWWVKLKDICKRAQTSINSSFDPIKKIQRICEEYQPTNRVKIKKIAIWVKRHPHSYGLTGGIILLILFFVLGLFKAQWRQWCWGVAVLSFLVLILSLLGGKSRQ